MANRRIRLSVEGTDPPHKRVRVTDFVRELQLLLSALRQVEWQLHPSASSSLYYHIVELSYASPATVVIEPLPADPTVDLSYQVVSAFRSVVRHLVESGESLPERVTHNLLEDLAGMAALVGRTLSSVKISAGDDNFLLTRTFQRHVEDLLRPEEMYPGSIRGMLEAINVHRGVNVFRIYPDVGPSKITCHFPAQLQAAAIVAIGRFVEVRGTLKYKASAPYPHEVEVDNLEALPEEQELPSLSELRGVAPQATGSQLSEEFVRALRNASG